MRLPSNEERIFFEQAVVQYQTDLSSDTSAQAYLTARGLSPQAAATYRLGVVRNPLRGHEQFAGRLCIPYLTPGGVVTFTFRCLEQHSCKETVLFVKRDGKEVVCKKYRAPEGAERTLYNVADFKVDSQTIYVCEGEIDTLSLSLSGFPAIGVPGVSQWKDFFSRCFADYPQIFCVADGDDAGYKMGAFLAKELGARIIRPPSGADINSIYSTGGANAVRTWLSGAVQ